MEISELLFRVAILLLAMMPGVVMRLCRLAPTEFGKGISGLVLYIAQPLLVLYSYLGFKGSLADIWENVLAVLVFSVVAHLVFAAAALGVFRGAPEEKRRMLRMATVFSNAAFMGIPLIKLLMGAECAIYASIYNITYNIFLWTFGVHLCTVKDGEDLDGDGDSDRFDRHLSAKKSLKKHGSGLKVLTHPVTVASALGILCLIFSVNVDTLQGVGLDIAVQTLDMLSALVAPLSMIVIGLRIPEIRWRDALMDGRMYFFLALRHLVLPLAVVGIMRLCILVGIPISTDALTVVTILASAPSASSCSMFAEKFGCDTAYTGRLVTVSTIVCVISMPAVLAVATLGL